MRLGEFFVSKGIISNAQLEEALRGQLIFGGHLGTCLLEMGYIEEDVLGRSLSELFGVGYAPPHLFDNIPRAAIERLPRRLVEKHFAVPFDLRERNLDVGLIDPRNLPALDELAFATGLATELVVAEIVARPRAAEIVRHVRDDDAAVADHRLHHG